MSDRMKRDLFSVESLEPRIMLSGDPVLGAAQVVVADFESGAGDSELHQQLFDETALQEGASAWKEMAEEPQALTGSSDLTAEVQTDLSLSVLERGSLTDETVSEGEQDEAEGRLLLVPDDPDQAIVIGDFGGDTTGSFLIDGNELSNPDGFSEIVVGSQSGSHEIQIGDPETDGQVFVNAPLSILNPALGGEIRIDDDLIGVEGSSLYIEGSGFTTTLNADLSFPGDELINDSVEVSGSRSVTAGTGGAGNIQFGGLNGNKFDGDGDDTTIDKVTLNAKGAIRFDGLVGSADPLEGITIGSDATMHVEDVVFNDWVALDGALKVVSAKNVSFGGNVSISEGGLAFDSVSGNVSFGGRVDVYDDVVIYTSGSVTFNSSVTVTGGSLRIFGATDILFKAGVSVDGDILLEGDEVNFAGGGESVSGSGTLTLRPTTVSNSVEIGSPPSSQTAGTLNITSAEIRSFSQGFSEIIIGAEDSGHADAASGSVRIGSIGAGEISFQDNMTIYGGTVEVADFRSDSTIFQVGGDLTIDAHGDIAINNTVESFGTVTLYSAAGAVGQDGDNAEVLQGNALTVTSALGMDLDYVSVSTLSAENTGSGDVDINIIASAGDVSVEKLWNNSGQDGAGTGNTELSTEAGDIVIVADSSGVQTWGTGAMSLAAGMGAGAGDADFDPANGTLTGNHSITVGEQVKGTSGHIYLNAQGEITLGDKIVQSGAGDVTLTSSGAGISQNAAITSAGGTITVTAAQALVMADGALTRSLDGAGDAGSIVYRAGADVSLSELQADGTVAVTSTAGGISDITATESANILGDDNAAPSVTLSAANGIGTSGEGDIDTDISTLAVVNGSTGGEVYIHEADGVAITSVAQSSSGLVSVIADAGDVKQQGGVTTSGGDVLVQAVTGCVIMGDETRTVSDAGDVEYSAGVDVRLSVIESGGDVTVTAGTGAIVDVSTSEDANIVAVTAILSAAAGIGSGGDLDTEIGSLELVNTTTGDIVIDEVDSLTLTGVASSGDGGDILVRTAGNSADITVAGDITSAAGSISLDAGRSILQSGDITASTAGQTIDLLAAGSITMAVGAGSVVDGNIRYEASEDILLGSLNAGTGNVALVTGSGNVTDADAAVDTEEADGLTNITAGALRIDAGGNVGSESDRIALDVGSLAAEVSGTSGMFVVVDGDLTLRSVAGVSVNRVQHDGTAPSYPDSAEAVMGGIVLDGAGADLMLRVEGGLSQETGIDTAGGTVQVSTAGALSMNADAAVVSGGGDVFYRADSGNITLNRIDAGEGSVAVKADVGSILDLEDDQLVGIEASGLILDAGAGVGTGDNHIETRVEILAAAASGDEGMFVSEAGTLQIGAVVVAVEGEAPVALQDVVVKNGAVVLGAGEGLAVNQSFGITAEGAGNVLLNVTGDVTLLGSVDAGTGNLSVVSTGKIELGSEEVQTGDLKTSSDGTIDIETSGENGSIEMHSGSSISAGSGNIRLDASRVITVSEIETSGNVSLKGVSIMDGGVDETNVAASELRLEAVDAAGESENHLEVTVSRVSVAAGAGGMFLTSTGTVQIAELSEIAVKRVQSDGTAPDESAVSHGAQSGLGAVGTITVEALSGNIEQQAEIIGKDAAIELKAGDGAITMAKTSSTSSTGGAVSYQASLNIALSLLSSDSGTITVTAGSITDITELEDANISAVGLVSLMAETGIGGADDEDIDTAINTLQAENRTSGSIFISESNELVITGSGVRTLGGDGSISVDVSDGRLEVGSVISAHGIGNVTLEAAQGILMQNFGQNISSSGGDILLAADVIEQKGDLATTGTGTISVVADKGDITMTDGTSATSGDGSITYSATGNVALSLLTSDSGAIDVTAGAGNSDSGAVSDNKASDTGYNIVTTGLVTLAAETGIGDSGTRDIDTSIHTLTAVTNSGNIFIQENSELQIAQGGMQNLGGNIVVDVLSGDLETKGAVQAKGNIRLATQPDSSIRLGEEVKSESGDISILAGKDISQAVEGDIAAAGGTVDVQAGGEIIMSDGAVASTGGHNIRYQSGTDVTLGSLDAGSGIVVVVTDTGSIMDDGNDRDKDITAEEFLFFAGDGVSGLELSVSKVAGQAGTGGIDIRKDDGIVVGSVTASVNRVADDGNAAPLEIKSATGLDSDGRIVLIAVDGDIEVQTGPLSTDGGTIDLQASGKVTMSAGTSAGSGGGNIRYKAGETVTIDDVDAGTGGVSLIGMDIVGLANDVVDVSGEALVIAAQDKVDLKTTVSTLAGSAADSGLFVSESDGLNIGAVSVTVVRAADGGGDLTQFNDSATGLTTANSGAVVVTLAAGDLTVGDVEAEEGEEAEVIASGNIRLAADSGYLLLLNDVTSVSGAVTLSAGSDLVQYEGVKVSSSGGDIFVDAGSNLLMYAGSSTAAKDGDSSILYRGGDEVRIALLEASGNVGVVSSEGDILVEEDHSGDIDSTSWNIRGAGVVLKAAGDIGSGTYLNEVHLDADVVAAEAGGDIRLQQREGNLSVGNVSLSIDVVFEDGKPVALMGDDVLSESGIVAGEGAFVGVVVNSGILELDAPVTFAAGEDGQEAEDYPADSVLLQSGHDEGVVDNGNVNSAVWAEVENDRASLLWDDDAADHMVNIYRDNAPGTTRWTYGADSWAERFRADSYAYSVERFDSAGERIESKRIFFMIAGEDVDFITSITIVEAGSKWDSYQSGIESEVEISSGIPLSSLSSGSPFLRSAVQNIFLSSDRGTDLSEVNLSSSMESSVSFLDDGKQLEGLGGFEIAGGDLNEIDPSGDWNSDGDELFQFLFLDEMLDL